ncbi:hypothetical protein BbiDN127_D0029 (plasmid) [Borreliella bissettiae DN127]|uniref:Uncharacterized protein n=1 Tax=Borrelia bissettiae (strain DSM 17990 / CIP 109136 / DN127) TaxID=521010 RepID=G0AP05_BORBD|nr:hypothetical protein BbiDN127_D0029 [Borreliella bissettiae DN127]
MLSCIRKFQILFKKRLLNKWSYYFLANYKNPTIGGLIIDFTQKRMFGGGIDCTFCRLSFLK